jgi:hypothetical protein
VAEVTPTRALDSLGRQSFVVDLPDLATLPRLNVPSPRFACLVAFDSVSAGAAELLAFGRSLIQQGAAYVCAWGPGCTQFEDAVDQAGVELDIERGKETSVVMTTAHPDDTLEEALEFLSFSAFPADEYANECRTTLGIAIGNREWSARMMKWFTRGRETEPAA